MVRIAAVTLIVTILGLWIGS